MHVSNSLRSIALGALLVSLIVSSDSAACWRGRHRKTCDACCEIPCWVRFIDSRISPDCPDGYDCYCCENYTLVMCPSHNCDPGTKACIKHGNPVSVACPPFMTHASDRSCCGESVNPLLFAMVCDCRWHVMRFARPCEEPDGYFSLCFLGAHCAYLTK